ncbi:MAG TPA: choice-of-anchor D domain-containing protein [Ignavibacteriaceae bacterium]|nr:choice-of-anchor D domain-containing protein [Ignavibacteriaceae bacterium]
MKKIFFLFFLLATFINSQTLINTVNLPSGTFWSSGYGLVYDNSKYWISSSSSTGRGVIYAVDEDGLLVDTVLINYPSMRESQGLAYDGTNFWYVERKTARCDLFKVDNNGNVLDSITSTQLFGGSWYFGGAAWDGTGLWISVYYPDASVALYKINTSTKQVVDTINFLSFAPGQLQPQGITVKGDTLFFVNDGFQGVDKIYAVSLLTKDSLFTFNPPEQPGLRQNPRGLAWDGNHFWLLAEPVGASSGRQLFKYDLGGSGSPGITILTPTVNFGNVMIDSTLIQNISVFNYGTADLVLSASTVSNAVFTIQPAFPITVLPGQIANIPISFTPTANLNYNDSVLIYHNDPIVNYSKVILTGSGVFTAPFLTSNPASINFGTKRINSTSYIELTLNNAGSNTLQIDSVGLNSTIFYFEQLTTPLNINPLSSSTFRVWFNPTAFNNYTDSINIYSNASNGSLIYIPVSGSAINVDPALGNIFWQSQIPDNPGTSFQDYTPRSMKKIQDVNGDGVKDLAVATENYWTLVFNGNSSGSGNILWKYSTYFGSINTGSVDYEQGLQIVSDLNGDNHEDVVIGTGGGNEFVYALNGKTGVLLWEFGNAATTDDGDIMGLDGKRDFNNDGVPDILAAASGNESTGSGRFSVYLLNGVNGNEIWRINQQSQQKLKYMVTSTDFGGAAGSRVGSTNEVIGFNRTGSLTWTFPTTGTPWTVREISNVGNTPGSDVVVGTTTGSVYCLSGDNGTQIWFTSIGNVFIEDLKIVPDVNQSGYPDILVSGINQNIFMLEGSTGSVIWSNSTGGNILGKDVLGDLNADGIPEVGSASLNDIAHVYNGVNGNIIFNYAFGSGSTSNAAEHIVDLDDVDGNYSNEFAACSRDGRVILFSGGIDVVPVEMITFSAFVQGGNVNLNWITATETNNSGFEIQRSLSPTPSLKEGALDHWEKIGFEKGNGTTTERSYYSFVDESPLNGKIYYRLKQIDYDGTFEYSNEIEVEVGAPLTYALEQNYPNPFNPITTIRFAAPVSGNVKLTIFNSLGESVESLQNGFLEAGFHKVSWDASKYSSGVYYYRLESENFNSVKKMIVLK